MDEQLFFAQALAEVKRARELFPLPNLVLAALVEEVGELAQAMLKERAGQGRYDDVCREAVHVAAMACRVATEGDPSLYAVLYEEPGSHAVPVSEVS